MPATLSPPSQLAQYLADLKFTDRMNDRVHDLLDRNSAGELNALESDELEFLISLNETMTLLKAEGLRFLGLRPERI